MGDESPPGRVGDNSSPEKKDPNMDAKGPPAPEKGKVPAADQERKRSVSVQDLVDMRTNQERFDAELKQVNALVTGLVKGLSEKVIPMLDEHQAILSSLPKQLEESFTKQTEQMKGYIERRLNPVNEQGQPQPQQQQAPTTPKKGTGLDLKTVLDWADARIKEAGGVQNLLGGSKTSPYTISLDDEFRDILTTAQRVAVNEVKLSMKRNLGVSMAETASAPVKVQAP